MWLFFVLIQIILQGTGLEDDLSGDGPFTFLAPTDSTFYELEEEDLKILTEDKRLAARVLRQHLLPGKSTSPCNIFYKCLLIIP
jgi:uncharacterized surface protein with fasciclin (FAS1) repeats